MPINARFNIAYHGFELAVDLRLPTTGVTTLFGPSGSGKSTLLRCVAGLEKQCSGYFKFDDEVWQDSDKNIFTPTYQRPIGYVFQEPRLFPHMTVEKNLLYGYKRIPEHNRNVDFDQVIHLLGIEHLLQRKPDKLSGGEQQRVSIGRALLSSPKLLLMDEPLAALDVTRKQEVLPFIRRLRDSLNIPVLYVSHSLQEVLQITDTMVLMEDGTAFANGTLLDICSRTEFGHYFGNMAGSVIETVIAAHETDFSLSKLSFAGGTIYVPQLDYALGKAQRVHILAKNVGIALQEPQVTTSFMNILQARVVDVAVPDIRNHTVMVKLDVGVPLLASISRKSLYTLKPQPEQKCYALIKAVSLADELNLYS